MDVNINRAQEGLRVCEDIIRFVLNNYYIYRKIKNLRHRLHTLIEKLPQKRIEFIKERQDEDFGQKSIRHELKRDNCQDILFANLQRSKESLRVLEEFSKLIDRNLSEEFKSLRYETYRIEKKIALRL